MTMMRSTAAVRLLAGDKEPVRVASTANLSLVGLLTVDGVVTKTGDRILVKDQTNATENGIYTVFDGTWSRASDASSSRVLISGMKVAVQEGATHAGDVWKLDTNRPNFGDDDISFSFYLNTDIQDDINAAREALVAEMDAIISTAMAAGKATQPEAEAGVSNVGWMTPLRTSQFFQAADLHDVNVNVDTTANNVLLGDNVFPDPHNAGGIFTAAGNTAVGTDILITANNVSSNCTLMGTYSASGGNNLYCCEGYGFRTMLELIDGQYVCAIGCDAAFSLEYGRSSVFVGAKTGLYKTDVRESVLLGVGAGYGGGSVSKSIVIGLGAGDAGAPDAAGAAADPRNVDQSILIGYWAGRYHNATNNLVIGNEALTASNVIGGGNTIIGNKAAQALVDGTNNVVVGDQAGQGVVSGSKVTLLGYGAYVTVDSQNCTSLGADSSCTSSNQVTLGNGLVNTLRCATSTITTFSDARDKYNIADLEPGLAFIRDVRPRQFMWDRRDGIKKTDKLEAGIIAQELDELQKAHGVEWMGLVDKSNPDRLEAAPGKLLFPLIKAVQELSAKVEAQSKEIAALKPTRKSKK